MTEKTSGTEEPQICPKCYGCGMMVKTDENGRSGRTKCDCRRPIARKKLVESFPEKLLRSGEVPHLSTIRPRRDLHRHQGIAQRIFDEQEKLIRRARKNPTANFFFAGDNGCGKTHLAYSIALNSFDLGYAVVVCTLSELLEDFRRYITAPSAELGLNIPRITADQLLQKQKKYSILIDEADKASPSEFRSEQLFLLLNAAANYGHQIIATSNRDSRRFAEHWSRCDESYGNSIAKRLAENAVGFEVFYSLEQQKNTKE